MGSFNEHKSPSDCRSGWLYVFYSGACMHAKNICVVNAAIYTEFITK